MGNSYDVSRWSKNYDIRYGAKFYAWKVGVGMNVNWPWWTPIWVDVLGQDVDCG